jgi:hypothetical protein
MRPECRGSVLSGGCRHKLRRGDGLVHDGEGVAHGTVARFGEQGQGSVIDFDLLLIGDGTKLADDVVEADGVKAEVLAARADGLRDVFRLGSGEHEDGPIRGLFKGLEQGVPGGIGDLVGLVEDDDAVLALVGGPGLDLGGEQPCVVNAAVGGGIDLLDVKGMRLLKDGDLLAGGGGDLPAVDAVAAGFLSGTLLGASRSGTVERRCKDARDGGLADAAMTTEDVAVSDAMLRQGVEQGAGDVVLPDDVREELGAVLAG